MKQSEELEEIKIADQFTQNVMSPNMKQQTWQTQSNGENTVISPNHSHADSKTDSKTGIFSSSNLLHQQPRFEESKWRAKLVAMNQ